MTINDAKRRQTTQLFSPGNPTTQSDMVFSFSLAKYSIALWFFQSKQRACCNPSVARGERVKKAEGWNADSRACRLLLPPPLVSPPDASYGKNRGY
jgi:hypothetical protein